VHRTANPGAYGKEDTHAEQEQSSAYFAFTKDDSASNDEAHGDDALKGHLHSALCDNAILRTLSLARVIAPASQVIIVGRA
jgi:hypothetical protein